MGIKDDGVEKGFHLYLFMDLNYVGSIVDKRFFDTGSMVGMGVRKGKSTCLSNSLHQYCEMWVCVLRKLSESFEIE